MAPVAMFYHLTRRGLDETVEMIVQRALAQDWRVMLRSTSAARLAHLDDRLWEIPKEGFIPHGLQGGGQEERQPVLLGQGPITNQAQGLMLLDGALALAVELAGLQRVWLIFDGSDAAAVQAARGEWQRLTGQGLAAQYWSDESGSWEKKQDRPAQPPAN